MKKILVPLAEGFEEIEAITLIDLLRRAGAEVIIASLNKRNVTGSHGLKVIADTVLDEVLNDDFEMVVLPGGVPGVAHSLPWRRFRGHADGRQPDNPGSARLHKPSFKRRWRGRIRPRPRRHPIPGRSHIRAGEHNGIPGRILSLGHICSLGRDPGLGPVANQITRRLIQLDYSGRIGKNSATDIKEQPSWRANRKYSS